MPAAILTDKLTKLRNDAIESCKGDSIMKPADRVHAVGMYSTERSDNYYIVEINGGGVLCANIQRILNKEKGWQGVRVIPKISN